MDGDRDAWMEVLSGWMEGRTDAVDMDGLSGWMDGWMDGFSGQVKWMDERVQWVDGWMDGGLRKA